MMPGGSSATLGETPKQEPPTSLLGATGRAGSAALNDSTEVKGETPQTTHSAISVSEGARRREQYCVSVRVVTARDQKPLQAYAWNEGLLNDFFKATIGLQHTVIITSPTECVIFTLGCSNGLGMNFDDSIRYCYAISSLHMWVGTAIQVTALQCTVKEGQHDITRAKEFTHERTKQRLAQLHSATPTTPSPAGSPKHPTHPAMESPRGRGMTRRMDCHYVQETIKNMQNLGLDDRLIWDEPRQRTSTPDAGQYDSADQEQDMEEDDITAELDFDSKDYDTEEEPHHAKGESLGQKRL